MIKKIKIIILALVLCIIQLSIVNQLFTNFVPNLALIGLVTLILFGQYKSSILWIVTSSLILDSYSSLYFGTILIIFSIIFFLSYYIFKKIISQKTLLVVLLSYLFAIIIFEIFPFIVSGYNYIAIISSIFMNMLLGILTYYFIDLRPKEQFFK